LIESAEQTKHRYGSDVHIDIVKNTGILNIVSERKSSNESLDIAISVAKKIVADHKALREEKVKQFQMLLSATTPNQSELMKVVDTASSSTPTRITKDPNTVALSYSGQLGKGIAIGFFAAVFIALLFALTLDVIKKIKSAQPQP
jgi:capsular polysaccharide biosynthesis protein